MSESIFWFPVEVVVTLSSCDTSCRFAFPFSFSVFSFFSFFFSFHFPCTKFFGFGDGICLFDVPPHGWNVFLCLSPVFCRVSCTFFLFSQTFHVLPYRIGTCLEASLFRFFFSFSFLLIVSFLLFFHPFFLQQSVRHMRMQVRSSVVNRSC